MRHYRYDSQHRLIGITLPDGSDVAYRYDAFGRRIAKDMDGKTTQFLWQGDRLIAENIYQKGVYGWPLYRSYVYEPGTFKPMALLKGHGTTHEVYYYQLDHLGTPQELTDPGGKIVWSAHYRAYGNVIKFDINEISNPLRFQGQYYDEESGLHYNRHRYYNPNTGRYLTPDPIKLAGGLNSYQYVPNPTGWVDPLELNARCPGGKDDSTSESQSEPNPPEVSRNGAFRQAKSDAGIPMTQQPDLIYDSSTGETGQYKYVRTTGKNNESILDDNGKPIRTREYQYTRADNSIILIQDHSADHKYFAPGNVGDQPAHFNLRPIEKSRTGKLTGARDHFYFKDKK